MGPAATRYITREVQTRVRSEARDRCCLSGHLIPFGEINTEIESEVLERHHLRYISQGGSEGEKLLREAFEIQTLFAFAPRVA